MVEFRPRLCRLFARGGGAATAAAVAAAAVGAAAVAAAAVACFGLFLLCIALFAAVGFISSFSFLKCTSILRSIEENKFADCCFHSPSFKQQPQL